MHYRGTQWDARLDDLSLERGERMRIIGAEGSPLSSVPCPPLISLTLHNTRNDAMSGFLNFSTHRCRGAGFSPSKLYRSNAPGSSSALASMTARSSLACALSCPLSTASAPNMIARSALGCPAKCVSLAITRNCKSMAFVLPSD